MNSPSLPAVERLDVQAFINAQPLSPYQWRIVLLCFLIVFLDGLDTAAMGFIAPALTQDWGIDRAMVGLGMGVALIPETLCLAWRNEVRYLEIEPAGARSEIHAILPASEPSRAAQAFLATLKSGLDDA